MSFERIFVWCLFLLIGVGAGAGLGFLAGANLHVYLIGGGHLPAEFFNAMLLGLIGAIGGLVLGIKAARWQLRKIDDEEQ